MKFEILITYELKNGLTGSIGWDFDFSNDRNRNAFNIDLCQLTKGGYVSFIKLSKLICKHSGNALIINPIHINQFTIECKLDSRPYTPAEILNISSDCDCRRFTEIEWQSIKQF